MASPDRENVDPCPCMNPDLSQFEWLSEAHEYNCVRHGKTTLGNYLRVISLIRYYRFVSLSLLSAKVAPFRRKHYYSEGVC